MKTKVTWIPFEEVELPKDWSLPFEVTYQGKLYKITGIDYIDRAYQGVEING